MTRGHRVTLTALLFTFPSFPAQGKEWMPEPCIKASPSVFLRLDHHTDAVAISPDGKYLAVDQRGGTGKPELHIIERAQKKVIHRLPPIWGNSATFTSDFTRFVCMRNGKQFPPEDPAHTLIEVHDLKTGKLLVRIPLRRVPHTYGWQSNFPEPPYAHGGDVVVVASGVPPRSGGLALAARRPTVYSLKTGKSLGDLPGPLHVDRMSISRDGRWLLTLDGKRTLRVWDVEKRRLERVLYESKFDVDMVAISPDGKWCAAMLAFGEGHLEVFDRSTGKSAAYTASGRLARMALAFTADGKRIVLFCGSLRRHQPPRDHYGWALRVWDWQQEGPVRHVISPIPQEGRGAWKDLGWFSPHLMTADGNVFVSWQGRGVLILDLRNPNPPQEPAPEKEAQEKKAKEPAADPGP